MITVEKAKKLRAIIERAVAALELDNEAVRFTARFGGVSHPVLVPVSAVLAIYARETGQGMALPEDAGAAQPPDDEPTPPDDTPPQEDNGSRRGAHLRVVK